MVGILEDNGNCGTHFDDRQLCAEETLVIARDFSFGGACSGWAYGRTKRRPWPEKEPATKVETEGTKPMFEDKSLNRPVVTNGSTMKITVVDENGKPISNAEIRRLIALHSLGAESFPRFGKPTPQARGDSAG